MKVNTYKTVLVAGGTGFIGSHLCGWLVKDGYKVLCMDNLYTGQIENIRHLLENTRFSLVNHDLTTPVPYNNVSLIFNLTCPASPIHYQKDAVYTTKSAILGTLNLLEVTKKNHCSILQASTSEVYGDPLVHSQTEDYYGNVNPVGIRSCYDERKRCAESLCMDYHRQYGVQVKSYAFSTHTDHEWQRITAGLFLTLLHRLSGGEILPYMVMVSKHARSYT